MGNYNDPCDLSLLRGRNKEIKKALVKKLLAKTEEVANLFSRVDRPKNITQEIFKVEKIVPLSESTAAVYYRKNTEKIGLCFFYWINSGEGYWQYFFPTDSHIIGMGLFGNLKQQVEEKNFDKNN